MSDMPLSVLMLTDFLHEDAPGGSRRVVKEIAEGLSRCGHRVSILVPRWTGDEPAHRDLNGVAIWRYGHGLRGLQGLPGLVAAGRRLLADLRESRGAPYDVLHTHFAYSHLPALLFPPGQLARVTVRSFYGPWAAEGAADQGPRQPRDLRRALGGWARFRGQSLVERYSLARADATIVLSDYSRQQVAEILGLSPKTIVLVPGGVDHQRFTPAREPKADIRRRLGLPEAGPLVLTVRRLAARMGLDALITAMSDVVRKLPKARLVIVGQGAQRAQLEARTRALGLSEHVVFAGFVRDEDLPLYYQAADLFVLPSRSLEGFGLITLEAFSCGLPVIGTPVGATPELLGQIDARLILADASPRAIATGMCRYFDQLAGQISPAALRDLVLATYTWPAVVTRTEAVYRSALDHKDRPGHRARMKWPE